MDKNIAYQIELIDKYLDDIHNSAGSNIPLLEVQPIILEKNVETVVAKEPKVPLDMKMLQQRIDSVSVIKYYKDLKNERIRADDFKLETDVDEVFSAVQASSDNKPWPKLDTYTKKKKIQQFVDKLLELGKIEDKTTVLEELFQMLSSKKITKKTIEMDQSNCIQSLASYSLL